MKTPLFDLENWREIFYTLARNKTRTLLTAFGIFWGTAMLAMLLGGEKGLEGMLMSNFEGFATNSAVIVPSRRTISYQGFNKGSQWPMTTADISAIQAIEGVESVAAILSGGHIPVSHGKHSTTAPVQGVNQDFTACFLPTITAGRFINVTDQMQKRKVAVIGTNIAAKLFPDSNPLGEFINLGGIHYKVIGVARQEAAIQINGSKIDDQINVPLSTLAATAHLGDNVDSAMLNAAPNSSPAKVKERVKRAIRARHPIHPDDDQALFFHDISEQFAMVDNLFAAVTLLTIFVGIGTLIAGVIGVGNIMWVIVKERTQEIGIRRAIGAKPIDIITQVLSEGIALTFMAGLAGIVFATIVLGIAQHITHQPFQMQISQALSIIILFMILGCLAGLIPSLKSMKIKPIEALNDK